MSFGPSSDLQTYTRASRVELGMGFEEPEAPHHAKTMEVQNFVIDRNTKSDAEIESDWQGRRSDQSSEDNVRAILK